MDRSHNLLLTFLHNPGFHHVLDKIFNQLYYSDIQNLSQTHPDLHKYIKDNERRLWNRFSVIERLLMTGREALLERILNYCNLKTLKSIRALNKSFHSFLQGNLRINPWEETLLNVHDIKSIYYHIQRGEFLKWQRKLVKPDKTRYGAITYYNIPFLMEQLEKLKKSEPSENNDWEIYF